MNPIPYGRQEITQDDIDAVVGVLKSDFLTQGPEIERFENAFAEYIGVKYAVAVSSGTAALHLCILSLEVKPGDKVITTPITFSASANCVLYAGGEAVFADIDPETYLLDLKEVENLLRASPKGTYQGIILVDFAGRAVNLESFKNLADEYGCWIIEDACHAPGGFFNNSIGVSHNCGSGDYANLAVFSFHPVKHIAAGEGGMITTNNDRLYKKLLHLRTHGITKDSNTFQNPIDEAYGEQPGTFNPQLKTSYPGWYYEMQSLGYNYRLTDFQAVLGISQLKRANEGLGRRIEIAQTYFDAFKNRPFIKGQSGLIDGHAYHLYIIEVEDRIGLYEYLRKNKILAQIHYVPVHLLPYYKQFGWKKGDMPNAEKYYSQCISLPMFPTLRREEQLYVIEAITGFYEYNA